MMKTVLNAVLVVAIIVMGYLCVKSIQKPIDFQNAKEKRQAAVVKKLIDIRKAEECFKDQYGHYTANWDSLITLVKTGEKAIVSNIGTISDYQLSKGLTEAKAWKMVYTHNGADAAKYGIEDFDKFCREFRRDTTMQSILEATFGKDYPIDTIATVPYTGGKEKFELRADYFYNKKSDMNIPVFEAKVPNKVYLNGLDQQEIINLDVQAKNMEKYAGLKVGDIETANNGAGNWE